MLMNKELILNDAIDVSYKLHWKEAKTFLQKIDYLLENNCLTSAIKLIEKTDKGGC